MEKIKQILRLTTLLVLFVLYAGYNAFASDDPYMVKKFDASGVSMVDVETAGGSITVEGKNGANDIVVEMYVKSWKSSLSKSKIDEKLEDFDIEIAKEGNKIIAHAERDSWFSNSDISISFVVYTPSSISTDLNTSGGSIRIANLSGDQRLHTSGGSIDMKELNGEVLATTSGGSLNLHDINGNVKGTTSGGSITSENLKGEFELKTSGGSINLDDINGSMHAETSGGGIRANIQNITGDITLKTSGGSIHATLPEKQGMNIKFKGNSVNTSLMNFNGKAEDDWVEGSMNGGGSTITMVTSGGSVNVKYQ